MTQYSGARLKNDISIGKLYSVHYFEYPTNFKFKGEKHNFWEIVYADKGDIIVFAENEKILLSQGNAIFHKPDEWHNLHSGSRASANVVVVSFECTSPAMNFFENKILTVGQEQKIIFSKIIAEYTNVFQTPLNNPYTTDIIRKKEGVVGGEQLLRQYIAELLISFLRHGAPSLQKSRLSVNRESALCNIIVNYMMDHVNSTITISELVSYSGSNKTTIAEVIKNSFGMSIMEYFISLKIDAAKKYLREDNYNISQIAHLLGYSSIHYFSRQFKKETGMSPAEYTSSIRAIVESI